MLFPNRKEYSSVAISSWKNTYRRLNFPSSKTKWTKMKNSFSFSFLESTRSTERKYIYIYISRSKIEWVGRKSRRSAIRILVRIDLRDDRGTISRANRSRSDPAARNVEGIEADERSEKAVHDPEDPGSRDRHPTETSGQKLSKISADKKTAGFL